MLTRIQAISFGVTGILFTDFKSFPTWMSPFTHKHKCIYPQRGQLFTFQLWSEYCAQTNSTEHHFNVDWRAGIYNWKVSQHYHIILPFVSQKQGWTTGRENEHTQTENIWAERSVWICTCQSWSYLQNGKRHFMASSWWIMCKDNSWIHSCFVSC